MVLTPVSEHPVSNQIYWWHTSSSFFTLILTPYHKCIDCYHPIQFSWSISSSHDNHQFYISLYIKPRNNTFISLAVTETSTQCCWYERTEMCISLLNKEDSVKVRIGLRSSMWVTRITADMKSKTVSTYSKKWTVTSKDIFIKARYYKLLKTKNRV